MSTARLSTPIKRIKCGYRLMEQNPQSQLKLLVQRGKEQGYLTYAEV
ncbi:hypothetical protein COO49_25960, partial [Klebsiella pneumoniae]